MRGHFCPLIHPQQWQLDSAYCPSDNPSAHSVHVDHDPSNDANGDCDSRNQRSKDQMGYPKQHALIGFASVSNPCVEHFFNHEVTLVEIDVVFADREVDNCYCQHCEATTCYSQQQVHDCCNETVQNHYHFLSSLLNF